ncbi:MAG: hypothetical protein PHX18_08005 [Candidatus Gastranaerophilales bacterium]|nr:hypothetical protein [Candidatus Gastranaerophilales bacterium]
MPITNIQNNFSQFKTNTTTQTAAEPKVQQQATSPASAEIKKDSFEKSTKFKTIGAIGYPLLCIALGAIQKGVKNEMRYLGSAIGLIGLPVTVGIGYLIGKLTDNNINKGRENKTTGKPTVFGAISAILGGGLIGISSASTKLAKDVKFAKYVDSPHFKKFGALDLKKLKNVSAKGAAIGAATLGAAYFGLKALLKNSANKAAETKAA